MYPHRAKTLDSTKETRWNTRFLTHQSNHLISNDIGMDECALKNGRTP